MPRAGDRSALVDTEEVDAIQAIFDYELLNPLILISSLQFKPSHPHDSHPHSKSNEYPQSSCSSYRSCRYCRNYPIPSPFQSRR